jgi:hypothetical protein
MGGIKRLGFVSVEQRTHVSVTGKRRFRSIIEAAISSKANIEKITADTFRSDAAAILESLIGEFDENIVLEAMNHQGFEAEAYRSSIRALAAVARERRPLRRAGSRSKTREA